MPQRELLQKRRRRTIEKRPAESLPAADDVDKCALVERFENRARTHTTDLLYLGASDRLSVGDDRERLERGGRQPLRASGELGALDRFGVFRPRQNLPAAGDFDEL